jgi:hypothetical protein
MLYRLRMNFSIYICFSVIQHYHGNLTFISDTNTTLTPLRKALRMRGVKGLPGHKKVTQCLRSGNAAYVAHTPPNVVGT